MPRIRSMVVLLDDGTYRTIDVSRSRSVYLRGLPPEAAHLKGGEGEMASPPADRPQWDYYDGGKTDPVEAPRTRSAETRSDGGDPPTCFYVDGIWVCI